MPRGGSDGGPQLLDGDRAAYDVRLSLGRFFHYAAFLDPMWIGTVVSNQMKAFVWLVVAVAIPMTGCGGKKRVSLPIAALPGSAETGIASWYGHPYHGRQAANGEIFDMEKMTAAHRTLPFGTWVQVRNLTNDKTVDVRITDRGPFVGGRIIDLSRAGAEVIAMIGPGTATVRITVIDPPAPLVTVAPPSIGPAPSPVAPPKSGPFAVQVGVFADRQNAERIRLLMEQRYGSSRVVARESQPALWRVLVGREETQESAESLASRIRSDPEAGSTSAFVVKVFIEKETTDSL
jgi:rare lipoprotein A